jgi:DNA polymerase III subunit delta'
MRFLAEMSDSANSLLQAQMESNRVLAAYLLTGQDGERKKEMARDFAKALNCLEKRSFEGCGCASCKKIESGAHPDIRWYGVDEDESSIKIEAVRDLQNWLSLKPYEGRTKVFILNEAQRLTRDAQNALLKSLEEPPPASVLILLAQKKADFLDTVVSRLAEIKVTPYGERDMMQILRNEGADLEEARFLARFASGSLSRARAMADSAWLKQKNETLKSIFNDTVSGFERLVGRPKKETLEWLTLLSVWVRDACALHAQADPRLLIYEDRLEGLKSFAGHHSLQEMLDLYDAVEETKKAIEDNANVKLALARLQIIWRKFSRYEQS